MSPNLFGVIAFKTDSILWMFDSQVEHKNVQPPSQAFLRHSCILSFGYPRQIVEPLNVARAFFSFAAMCVLTTHVSFFVLREHHLVN